MSNAVLDLCMETAARVYGSTAPSPGYAERVGYMLAGIAAKESNLKYRRQLGFNLNTMNGAWGLFQLEWRASIHPSIRRIAGSPALSHHVGEFVTESGKDVPNLYTNNMWAILRHLATPAGDRLAAALARVHLLQHSESIPEGIISQASYWLRRFNGYGSLKPLMRHRGFLDHQWTAKEAARPDVSTPTGRALVESIEISIASYVSAFQYHFPDAIV